MDDLDALRDIAVGIVAFYENTDLHEIQKKRISVQYHLARAVLALADVAEAAKAMCNEAPLDDDDRPYICDGILGIEFDKLASAVAALDRALKEINDKAPAE